MLFITLANSENLPRIVGRCSTMMPCSSCPCVFWQRGAVQGDGRCDGERRMEGCWIWVCVHWWLLALAWEGRPGASASRPQEVSQWNQKTGRLCEYLLASWKSRRGHMHLAHMWHCLELKRYLSTSPHLTWTPYDIKWKIKYFMYSSHKAILDILLIIW